MSKKRRIPTEPGQVVAVPLGDGTFGAGHVVRAGLFPVFALYARRAASAEGLVDGWDVAADRPVAVVAMPGWVADGTWPVVARRDRDYAGFDIPGVPPATVHTSHFAADFLRAYHGLAPWDGMHDPRYYERRLVPGTPVPPSARLKADFAAE